MSRRPFPGLLAAFLASRHRSSARQTSSCVGDRGIRPVASH